MNAWLTLLIGLLLGFMVGFFMGAVGSAANYRRREREKLESALGDVAEDDLRRIREIMEASHSQSRIVS